MIKWSVLIDGLGLRVVMRRQYSIKAGTVLATDEEAKSRVEPG